MRTKRIRIRTPMGARYEDVVAAEDIVEWVKSIVAQNGGSPRAAEFLSWADGLDHKATYEEINAWFAAHGTRIIENTTDYENDTN